MMNPSENQNPTGNRTIVGISAYAFLALLVLTGLVIAVGVKWSSFSTETQLGFIVVIGVATLMVLLFLFACGFHLMGIAAPDQALGLPEGSIRALIALILVMVFVIVGVYLFHSVDSSTRTDNKDAIALAQQLMTTVGTLVVAVSAFYFGSSTASGVATKVAAAAAAQLNGASSSTGPSITGFTPGSAAQNTTITAKISGSGFRMPRYVRLTRGGEVIEGRDLSATDKTVYCEFAVDRPPDGGVWDVIVVNADGRQGSLAGVFAITR